MLKSTMALLTDECKPEPRDKGCAWKQHLGNWGAFAAATGAALAMSTNASASIISSTIDLTVSGTAGPQTASFSVGGIGALLVEHTQYATRFSRSAFVAINPGPGIAHLNLKGYLSSSGPFAFPFHYQIGQPILAAGSVISRGALWVNTFLSDHGQSGGPFRRGYSKGFVGFSNAAGDLGWLQVQVSFNEADNATQAEVISWAYNDVAGAPINAGQTEGSSPTPEPGTAGLALLALGAAGILALRKRRSQLAAKVTQN